MDHQCCNSLFKLLYGYHSYLEFLQCYVIVQLLILANQKKKAVIWISPGWFPSSSGTATSLGGPQQMLLNIISYSAIWSFGYILNFS